MTRKMTWKAVAVACCLALGGAYACGDDGGGSSNNGGGNNGGNNADTSSFSAEVDTGSGQEQHSGSQSDSKADQSSWGATISGPNLQMTLVSSDGTVINAVVETSEAAKAPGDFAPTSDADGTTVTIVSTSMGNSYVSNGNGTITLENCPRAVGEHATGSFNNIALDGSGGAGSWTLDGQFDVVVFAKAGDLFCNEQSSSNNGGGTNNNTTNNGGTCDADMCANDGVCCPYAQCMNQCELNCLQSAECAGGMNPQACAQCTNGCLDECNVSSECRSAIVDLNTCSENNGCDTANDEEACQKQFCCAELKAAL